MRPGLYNLVVRLDNQKVLIVLEEVAFGVNNSLVAFSCLLFTCKDLSGSLRTVFDLTDSCSFTYMRRARQVLVHS